MSLSKQMLKGSYKNNTQTTSKRKKRQSEDDILPVKPLVNTFSTPIKTRSRADDENAFRMELFNRNPVLFEDGYDFGDISAAILGTGLDLGLSAVKGVGRFAEGIGDAINYGVAGVADLAGKDDFANILRKETQKSLVDDSTKKATRFLNQYSVSGRTTDAILEGLGQASATMATGGLGKMVGFGAKATSALTTGATAVSGYGSGMSEAYQGGATDEEAVLYGVISGGSEALTEALFGGMGKGVNALGFSHGLTSADDMLAKKITERFTSQMMANFVEFGVKASAEGVEEVLSGVAQAVGKKLTYMSEKELSEILKDENLLEQFIVGTVTSGFMQSGVIPGTSQGSLKEAVQSGTDFISGLTSNEQAVVDKVYNDEIAKDEKNGKKLTGKDKSKIYDKVLNNLEKGYIDIDTIESVLGGETYNKYKKTADSEDAIQNEFNALNKMKQGDMTGEQLDRRVELKQQLEELKSKSQRSQLKTQLSNEVMDLVKGSKLTESYNEKTRRSQHFEADLSQYNEKQRETVKKAIDSGILNNTNRTREFVDMLAKISADKGVLFDFTNNEKLKNSSFAVEGKTVNGYKTDDGNVALNIDSSKSLNSVVGHEITHVLEGTELYSTLQEAAKQYAEAKGEYATRMQSLRELYTGVYKGKDFDVRLQEELTADIVGDYLFTDSDFINNLSTEQPDLFKKMFDEVKYLCKVAAAGSNEARALEKVKKTFEDAWKQNGTAEKNTTNEGGVRYLLRNSMLTEADLDNYLATGKTMHTRNKKKRLLESGKSPILTNLDEIRDFISDAIKGNAVGEVRAFARVSEGLADMINEKSGSLELTGKYLELVADDLRESYKIHSKPKEKGDIPLSDEDFENIPEFIDEIDGVLSANSYNGKVEIYLYKKTSEGYVKILTVSSKERNSLQVTKLIGISNEKFEQKYAKKIEKAPGSLRGHNDSNPSTKAQFTDETFSNSKVPQISSKVKGQFSLSAETEARYNEAVKNNDTETAQKLVDEVAKKAGYTIKGYHGTPNGKFTVFEGNKIGSNTDEGIYGKGFYFSTHKNQAEQYGDTIPVYLNSGNVLSLNDVTPSELADILDMWEGNFTVDDSTGIVKPVYSQIAQFTSHLIDAGYDSVYVDYGTSDEIVIFNPQRIKSADPVTYDDNGNVIPLSKRFNEDNNDIRYSLSAEGSQTTEHGTYNVHGADIAFADFPIRKDIKPKVINDLEGVPIQEDISKAPQKKSVNVANDDLFERREQLDEWYENRKAALHEELDDRSTFISNRAKEFYNELNNLKKGVRASSELGYFLDLGFKWSELKSTLLQVSKWPGEVIRPDSNVESIVREAIGREYEDRLYDFGDLDTEYKNKLAALENPENAPIQTVKERLTAKLDNTRKELLMNQRSRDESIANFDNEISNLQTEYDSKRDKNTKVANNILRRIGKLQRLKGDVDADYSKRISDLEARRDKLTEELRTGESQTEQGAMRKEIYQSKVDNIRRRFEEKGYDYDEILLNAKNLSTFKTVDNTPQRVMEKALGYEAGQIFADETVNKVAQNESEGIKWLNTYTDRKNGILAQLSKEYNIKPGSKESAAAQMYAEGFYVDENNEIIKYTEAELVSDFPDVNVRENIKGLAKDSRIRQIYDETLALINESRSRNAYPEIQRLDNYFLHYRAMGDTFSRIGLPFNPQDIKAKDLPTDLSGVTADLKPGQPYFASARHRKGKRTTFDLLGGLEKYLTSAKNQIYHIDDIQTLRALRNDIADTFGQANGLGDLDNLSEEEAQARIEKVFNSHMSTFAKFLNEEANIIAGKTALIDRGLEGIIGRRGITFLDDVNKQVGSNSVGFNFSSPFTNLIPVVQTFAKTQKRDFVKAFAQTVSNKLKSIHGKSDGFAENSPVIIRRKGAERFFRTPVQKINDSGYWLMGAIDDISTELIARTKYNEFTRKGMDSQQAHFETDKWVSRLMGDRSLGQMPQIFNSKMLGLITKFQLEVRNQLDSQFYDTIQEAKASNKHIEDGLQRNARIAAKVGSTFFQLAVLQHLFGIGFESVAGYNPAFDIIDVIIKTFGFDDDEDDEDTALDNIEEGFFALLEDMPYASTLTGGRIPISSALPIKQLINGADENGKEVSRVETLLEAAPYYVLPTGYGQIKKTAKGLKMFDDDLPIAGSYTDSGDLRFPVDNTFGNKLQAAAFGQYADENAQLYFDEGYKPLNEKQIQEYKDLELPIADYWKYREGLAEQKTVEDKFEYINSLDVTDEQKNIMINNAVDRKEKVDMSNYDKFADYEEFDFYIHNKEKYKFLQSQGVSYKDYKSTEDAKEEYDNAYSWYKNNPEKVLVSQAVTDNVIEYRRYTGMLNDIRADKDNNGKSISGSAKAKKKDYIFSLDIDDGAKCILFKSEYKTDNTYNYEIVSYLDTKRKNKEISWEEMQTILTELDFTVQSDGRISW